MTLQILLPILQICYQPGQVGMNLSVGTSVQAGTFQTTTNIFKYLAKWDM